LTETLPKLKIMGRVRRTYANVRMWLFSAYEQWPVWSGGAMSDTTHAVPVARKSISERFWDVITSATFVGLIILAFSLAGIGTLIYAVVKTLGSSANFGLPILALLSVLLLLGALLIFTTLIHTIGLSDKGSALGLPEGSVRALLALALLGLFAVLAASVLVNPSTPVDEFGKQMLTLVGTLMTAVISFYFGSATASVSTAPSGTTPSGAAVSAFGAPETILTGILPTRAKKGTSQTYTIGGKGLANVMKVEALAPGGGPPVTVANSNATESAVTFDFSFPGAGRWTMQITAGSGAPIPVPGVIEVTDS
jgi:hypothetical protein